MLTQSKLLSAGLLLSGVGIVTVLVWSTPRIVVADDEEQRPVEADSFGELDEEPENDEDFDQEDEGEGFVEHRNELLEYVRELTAEIAEVREEEPEFARLLTDRRRAVRSQIERLNRAIELERQFVQAEGDGDFDRAADLEEELESLEQEIEFSDRLSELNWAVEELNEIAGDDERSAEDRASARKLAAEGTSLVRTSEELKRAFERDDEDRIERLEEQVEQGEGRFHLGFAEFELGHEIREAKFEGDSERVRDLERELREVRAEMRGEVPEDPDDKPGDPSDEPALPREEPLPKVDASQLDYERDVRLVFQTFCFGCHGPDAQEAELNVAAQLGVEPLVRERESWLRIQQHVKTGVMPPRGEDRPSPLQRANLVAWIDREINEFDYSTVRSPGDEPVKRLTNREYDNTVRDLFGIDVRPASRFPADGRSGGGFDNSGVTLFLQPLVVERFFGAAEEVIDAALPATGKVSSSLLRDVVTKLEQADEDDGKVVETFLRSFLIRAYRRPLDETDVERLRGVYAESRKMDSSPRAALRRVLGVVLVSPSFLVHVGSTPTSPDDQRVSDWDLANRLSYFLWASMPDDRLFELAAAGRLSDAEVLVAEVDRMLDDARFESLGEGFAAQWLGYEHVGTRVRLDPIDNPWCTDSLMAAMREESNRFFVTLVRENRPLETLVDADFTFVNEELANHYGIDGVRGPELRRVTVDPQRRGGILGHASVLAATSFPDRTSPVNRGRWILGELLGTPPPPPPPNASEFTEAIEDRENLTLRRKLELHRRQPQCASCHDQIDPLGLSLENYGRFGRWRTRGEGGRIDATGRLPNGTQFSGLPGLRRVLVEQRMDDLRTQVTRKLLSYALGRPLEYFDESAVRSIVAELEVNDGRLRSLVHAVVTSYPFQYERRQNESEVRR